MSCATGEWDRVWARPQDSRRIFGYREHNTERLRAGEKAGGANSTRRGQRGEIHLDLSVFVILCPLSEQQTLFPDISSTLPFLVLRVATKLGGVRDHLTVGGVV